MTPHKLLKTLFGEIVREAEANPEFGERLMRAFTGRAADGGSKGHRSPGKSGRRAAAVVDPFEEFQKGELGLRNRLRDLDLERLRDVVAQYGMDPTKLAMKWKDKERLTDLIVNTVASRSRKGDAFRAPVKNAAGAADPEAAIDTSSK
jgi:hypothetical protein